MVSNRHDFLPNMTKTICLYFALILFATFFISFSSLLHIGIRVY